MSDHSRQPAPDGLSSTSLPPIQTSIPDSSSAGKPTAQNGDATPLSRASLDSTTRKSPVQGSHQRFVFTDPVAFRYLEEDPSTQVLARRQTLEGYEIYLVEQWACSRTHPTFIVTTYTGDPAHKVVTNVLSIPTDESTWSPQLRVYFKALNQYHARRRETKQGTLMITNMSSFPSSLTVISVPDGDPKAHRELFFVNENLKRLNCSGRLGIKLAEPSNAAKAKFHQLYRTSDKIPLYGAVIELVKLCQVALVLFGKLEPEYADGLLCDVTEKAINDWWVEFGTEFYNIEPQDGILGPTTVAALLGMLMGARNRLSAFNAPVSKDVFDIDSTKRGIAHFQKSQRLQRTRRLDRQTMEVLRRATAKAASGEGWSVPRAVKSTVAELSGKGGEMMMGMVGRDKAGIAEVETVDLERFVELVHGERAKWLWYGKLRKSTTNDMFSRLPEEESMIFQKDDQGGYAWSRQRRESMVDSQPIRRRDTEGDRLTDVHSAYDGFERDPFSKRAVLRKATGKIDARSGFGRIKEAVGRRSHLPKSSKDENGYIATQTKPSDSSASQRLDAIVSEDSLTIRKTDSRDSAYDPESVPNSTTSLRGKGSFRTELGPAIAKTLTETSLESRDAFMTDHTFANVEDQIEGDVARKDDTDNETKPPTANTSIAGSVYRGVDLTNLFPPIDAGQDLGHLLRRTQSFEDLSRYHAETRNDAWWPRHLSFSVTEDSILTWKPIASERQDDPDSKVSPKVEMKRQLALAEDAKRMRERLALLDNLEGSWVEERIGNIQELSTQADLDTQELDTLFYPRQDEYEALREDAHEIMTTERLRLQDAAKDMEVLGAKLEYEINGLRSRVDDADDALAEYERQVKTVEDKVKELEDFRREKENWAHWMLRIMTGIGRPPEPSP
ncbi:uncharacterized protein BDZ99DRAFT_411590 [Mytilinidion resinicola]|uniref:STB6-like N-terminal domain-containing protein n=1 Tax=Mytilinidion resinicola TaxID=574789 RepID=A0A6A6YX71_9PEZI|nr:uncharacterized protein BDZ99DRAFT_411590 [Mytilinidion resinicola]KAF2813119.1 hypothetical protein BDZ99DRAFT_411590 [Mytilinidion resinicola]